MAYSKHDTATVNVMHKNFGELAKEVADLEKKKPLPKDKVKALKIELDRKGKVIAGRVDGIIAAVQKDFLQHGAAVDAQLGEATVALKTAKKIAADFDPKAPDGKLLMALTKPSLADKVSDLADAALADSDAFGKSWFQVREWSLGEPAAMKPFVKSFFEKRSKLMGESKGVLTKIRKIRDLAEEVKLVTNDVRAGFTKVDGAAPGDAEESINELVAEFQLWHNDARKGGGKHGPALRAVKSLSTGLSGKAVIEQLDVEQVQAAMREGLAVAQAIRGKVDIFTKRAAQTKKMFGGRSKPGDTALNGMTKDLESYKDKPKELIDAVKEAAVVLKGMQARVKKAA